MPISTLDPAALAALTGGQLADLALERDQAARRLDRMGDHSAAREARDESEALAKLFRQK